MLRFSTTVVSPLLMDLCQEEQTNLTEKNVTEKYMSPYSFGQTAKGSHPASVEEIDTVKTNKSDETSSTIHHESKTVEQIVTSEDNARSPPNSGPSKTNHVKETISLAKDLDLKDRQEIYKNYLRYCLTGDIVQLGLGSTVVLERDEEEFVILRQLGDILGLTKFDVISVHQSVAEQGFKMKAQQIINDGHLTEQRIAHLKEIQQHLGLPDASAHKIIEGVQKQRAHETLSHLEVKGQLKMERLLELSEAGLEVANSISVKSKIQMLRREAEKLLTDGSGSFDKDEFLAKYSDTLKLDRTDACNILESIAKERMIHTLVYAISLHRQKRDSEMLHAVQNLVSQYRAFPQALTWDRKEEIEQMYITYTSQSNDNKLNRDAALVLGLTNEQANKLRDTTSPQQENEKTSMEDGLGYFG